jgi:transposase-like protein
VSVSKARTKSKTDPVLRERIIALFSKYSGNVSAVSRELGCSRSTIRRNIAKVGLGKKPLAGGKQRVAHKKETLPVIGNVKRYILTAAQNNTHVHDAFWSNVQAMAKHYDAQILVGTFSYNQNNFGRLAVKRGTKKPYEDSLWFDPTITPFISDKRIELAPGLIWCGNMNILPTEDNPISGLETYGGSTSVIFPHTKIEMRSIATTPDMPVKMIYTTGAVTLMNYLQKKLGIKAEHHHRYAFLLVEVDSKGQWWVRQVAARKNGRTIQDLNVLVEDGKVVTTKAKAEAITWGDLHSTISQPEVIESAQTMLDALHPKYQFLHDIMEGVSINRHYIKHAPLPHLYFHRWLRGLHRVDAELKLTRETLEKYLRPWCKTIVPDSNHDGWWLHSWLNKFDYRYDPANAELFLRLQNFMYAQIREGKLPKNVNLTQFALENEAGLKAGAIKFLLPDQSFAVGEVECGMHGHLGPDGAFGSPGNLSKIGKKATTAHTHSCGIYHGLYVAGTSSKLTEAWDYTIGPTSWSHSHVVLYPNGQRAIVTVKAGKWCADAV